MRESNLLSVDEEKELREKYKDKIVLVVEDEYVSRQLMFKMLSKYIIVELADNVDECLTKIADKYYSVIFMDINLGSGLTGLDAIKLIRQLERYEMIPIIATTAYAMSGEKEKIMEAGCTDYLSKPFTKGTILNLLKKINL